MPTIKESLAEQMKTALKAGNKDVLAYARNLHAAVRKKEIDDRIDLDDAGVQKIITSLVKQRQDSIEQFHQGGREDLVAKEQAELIQLVEAAIAEVKPTGAKDMGKVMKVLLPTVQGRADGKLVNQMVRERIEKI